MITDVIIMAGGFGERLWPASSGEEPKQFMSLNDNFSFLQNSIQRALACKVSGKIVIVTRKDIENLCAKQCFELAERESAENKEKIINDVVIISEPEGKHTSAAIMTGVCFLNKISDNSNHTVLVLTSDHVINPIDIFVNDCNRASCVAEEGKFVCFSIPPTEPSVGYGYIKTSCDLYGDNSVYKIEEFKEKPDSETARKYFESGKYFWNSGMFAFKSDFFLDEMKKCTPEVFDSFECVFNGSKPELCKVQNINCIKSWKSIENAYSVVPKVAVDVAIAEKTLNAVAVKSNFKWTDVGNWDTFSELCTNPKNSEVIEVNSNNNFVYSDIPVALCGVSDLVVVVKNGKVLVMKKGSSSLVRDVVKETK